MAAGSPSGSSGPASRKTSPSSKTGSLASSAAATAADIVPGQLVVSLRTNTKRFGRSAGEWGCRQGQQGTKTRGMSHLSDALKNTNQMQRGDQIVRQVWVDTENADRFLEVSPGRNNLS